MKVYKKYVDFEIQSYIVSCLDVKKPINIIINWFVFVFLSHFVTVKMFVRS